MFNDPSALKQTMRVNLFLGWPQLLGGGDVTAANIHHARASSLEYIICSGIQMNLRVLSAGRTVRPPLYATPNSRSDVRLQSLGKVLQISEA